MPHIQINVIEGKTEEQKQQLAAKVIKAAQSVVGLGDDSYSVSIEEFTKEQWKDEVYPTKIMGNQDILVKKPGYQM